MNETHPEEGAIRVMFPKPPGEGVGNPYRPLLYRALNAAGIHVSWTQGYFIPYWRAVIRQGVPDVIHLQWQDQLFFGRTLVQTVVRTVQFFLEMGVLRALGVKFVWTVHNLRNHRRRYLAWEAFASRRLARWVEEVVVHCRTIQPEVAEYLGIPGDKISPVVHGNYQNWYPEGPGRAEARRALALPEEARIFLYFGKIVAYKGVEKLVRIFRELEGPDLRLVVAGRPETAQLQQRISAAAGEDSRILQRYSYLEDEQLVQYLQACDLTVLPYRDILVSGSVILSASLGRPFIAPGLGCLKEFPAAGRILFQHGEEQGLAWALRRAAALPAEALDDMGAALQDYAADLIWEKAARQLKAIYLKAMK